jgi:hypothetical protein
MKSAIVSQSPLVALILSFAACGSQTPSHTAGQPSANDPCGILDTRSDISTDIKGKIDGSLDTLYKVAKANGDIEGAKKEVIHNLQQDVPIAGQDLIQIRAQYLFCSVWGHDPSIDPTKKAELYQTIMKIPNSSSAPTLPPTSTPQPSTVNPPAPTQWLTASAKVSGCGQSGCYSTTKVCGPLPSGKRFTGNSRNYVDSFNGWGEWAGGPLTDGPSVCRYYQQHSHNQTRDVSFEYEVAD